MNSMLFTRTIRRITLGYPWWSRGSGRSSDGRTAAKYTFTVCGDKLLSARKATELFCDWKCVNDYIIYEILPLQYCMSSRWIGLDPG